MPHPASTPDLEPRLAHLVETLRRTEREIQALTGDQVDAVVGSADGAFLLRSAQEELLRNESDQRELARTRRAILDAIPASIALLEPSGVIATVNAPWRRFSSANGLRSPNHGLGLNYLEVCDRATGSDSEEAPEVADGIRRVLEGTLERYTIEYPCHSDLERRWFRLSATPLHEEGVGGAVVMHQDISERKFAEFAAEAAADRQRTLMAELAIERSRLVAAQAVAKVGSWETDLRTLETHWSAETYAIFGLDPASYLPDHASFLEHCHPEDRARVAAAFEASMNTRALCTVEHRIVRGDGSVRHVEERWQTHTDGLGSPATAIGTCQDVSERIEAASAFEENQILLRVATTLSKVGAFRVLLADGRRRWSDEVCAIYDVPPGYTPDLEEALAFYLPEDRPRMRASFEACGRDGTPYDLELPIITRAGRHGWIRTMGEAVRDPSGKIFAIQGAVQDITERRAATRALLESEERFRQTFDQAPMGIIITATDGHFSEANATFRRMLGYTTAELRLQTFGDLTHPDDRPATLAAMALLVGGHRESMSLVKRYLAAGGRIIWARVNIAAPRDRAGQPLYFITGVEDITRERDAQQALQASEERFRLLSKAANDAIYDWDITANTTWYNEGYGVLYGLEDHALLGTAEAWARLVHDGDRDRVWRSLRQALDGSATTWASEYRFRRGDGSWAHVLDRGYIVRDAAGKAVRMIGAHTDLTSWKEAELRLTQQAALLDAAHDSILVKDMDDRITYWNKGAERNYGWPASEVIGKDAGKLFHVEPVAYQAACALLLDRGQWEGELLQRGKDGRVRDVSVRWSLMRDERGHPASVLAITSDVTERKRLELQFLRAQRLESLGTLAGGIAHDLNNVLAPILVSIELLRRDDDDPERLESLATIEASAKRGAAMVQQVLTFARGVEGKRHPIDITRIGRDVEKIARDTFSKGIAIQFSAAPDLWTVNADATQINQVLTNLCVNARDAMPDGGALTVTLANVVIDEVFARMNPEAHRGPYVAIAVSDTGVGIPHAVQQRLFEPFFTTKEIGKGTGLGLSTVHSIVHSHKGFVNLYSEMGKGARFTVFLPALVGAAKAVMEKAVPASLPRGDRELILVVDDEESIRSIVQRTLERFGYRVILAVNGAEGVARFVEHRAEVRVILTDMAMPVMDGPAMIAAIQAIDPAARIIASSGMTADHSVAEALAGGVTEFVSKPYTAETLLTSLYRVIHRHDDGPRLLSDPAFPVA